MLAGAGSRGLKAWCLTQLAPMAAAQNRAKPSSHPGDILGRAESTALREEKKGLKVFDNRDNTKTGEGGVSHGLDNYTATLGMPMLGEIYPEAR